MSELKEHIRVLAGEGQDKDSPEVKKVVEEAQRVLDEYRRRS